MGIEHGLVGHVVVEAPWTWFVPLLVVKLNIAPRPPRYWAEKLLACSENSPVAFSTEDAATVLVHRVSLELVTSAFHQDLEHAAGQPVDAGPCIRGGVAVDARSERGERQLTVS